MIATTYAKPATLALALLAALPLVANSAPMPANETVVGLKGRWAGPGEAIYKDGKREAFKCVVVYFTDKAGAAVRQTISCKSEGLELSLKNEWAVKEGSITGTWHETHYELKGTLLGSVDTAGYNLYAENEFANATIAVRSSGCEQEVVMKFSKQVDVLTAKLRKC